MTDERVREALERENVLWEAFRSRDRARIEALIDENALDVGPAGPLDRTGVLEAVEQMEIADYEISEFALRTFGDVEITIYRSTSDGTYGGRPFAAPVVWASTVWRRDGDRWVVIHRYEAPARVER